MSVAVRSAFGPINELIALVCACRGAQGQVGIGSISLVLQVAASMRSKRRLLRVASFSVWGVYCWWGPNPESSTDTRNLPAVVYGGNEIVRSEEGQVMHSMPKQDGDLLLRAEEVDGESSKVVRPSSLT